MREGGHTKVLGGCSGAHLEVLGGPCGAMNQIRVCLMQGNQLNLFCTVI